MNALPKFNGLDHVNDNRPQFCGAGLHPDDDSEQVELPVWAPTSDACLADLTHPPGLVGEIVDWIEGCSEFPSRELALGAALGWVATLVGRGFETPSRARTNFYMVALAPSGYGKDHAASCIGSLAMAVGLERFVGPARFMSASALRDTLMGQASVLSIQDEFGSILRQIDGPKVGIHNEMIRFDLLGLFSRAKDFYAGAAYASLKAVKLFNPNLSIYGMSTPAEFWNAVTSSRNADGFLPRFILFNVETPKPSRRKPAPTSIKPPQSIIKGSRDLYVATYGGGNLAVATEGGERSHPAKVVNLNEDATGALEAFERQIEEALARSEAKRQPFLNRAREHALKLALTVAVGVDHRRPVIDRVAMEWAIALAWTSTCALIREGELMIADNDRQRTFNRIVDIVRKAGTDGITEGRITDRLGATVRRAERAELMAEALQTGRIVRRDRRPEGLGRPSQRYVHRDFC